MRRWWLRVLVVAACGSTPSAATRARGPSAGAATAPPSAPARTQASAAPAAPSAAQPSEGAGASETTDSGAPIVAEGNWSKATGHVEITGGRTVTIEGVGFAVSAAGITSVNFADSAHSYAIGLTVSTGEDSGVAIVAPNLITGGTFGKECQVNVTRNEPAELAGTFSCTNAEAADPADEQTFTRRHQGDFRPRPERRPFGRAADGPSLRSALPVVVCDSRARNRRR